MPEVAEVAHVCALLRRNILGYRISQITLNNDPLLFPFLKNNPNAENDVKELKDNLLDSTINSIGRHGKYFWLRLNLAKSKETGVLLMHFGMTGMIKIKNVKSHLVFMENGGDKKVLGKLKDQKQPITSKIFEQEIKDEVTIGREATKQENKEEEEEHNEDWPPRFAKLEMVLEKDDQKYDLVFVDPRRLGRIRYLSGPLVQTNRDLLNQTPLSSLGPDYSKPLTIIDSKFEYGDPDPDHHGRPRLTIEDFNKLILSKKKPIKSLLLDQEHFAGIGNWVGDEICYHSRIHPNEILSNKLPNKFDVINQIIKDLYKSVIYVCEESVRLEGDVAKFPSNWLMLYRWGKRRKNSPKPKTSEGYEVDYITIGGRTSCFAPELQKPLKKEQQKDSIMAEDNEDDIQIKKKKRKNN